MFVSSLRILYKKRSDDPIFPADETWSIPGDPIPWYRNSDPRARPLACISNTEVCTSDGSVCWDINSPSDSDDLDQSPEFALLYASLYQTDIFYSIAKRQGRALLAQKLVSQYFSEALDDYHWIDEMQSLFETALARTQINAWSVASGEDAVHEGRDGYISITKGSGNLCGMYKYNPQGYQSLHFAVLLIVLVSVPSLWILSMDWNQVEQKGNRIWANWRTSQLWKAISKSSNTMADVASSPFQPRPEDQPGADPISESPGALSTHVPSPFLNEPRDSGVASGGGNSSTSDDEELKWRPNVCYQLLKVLFYWLPRLFAQGIRNVWELLWSRSTDRSRQLD